MCFRRAVHSGAARLAKQVHSAERFNVESAFSGAATRLDHFPELIRRNTFRTPQQKLLPLIMHPADSLAAVPTAAVVATT
jgi:hypothetical protein